MAELNDLPIKQVGDTTVYLRDVATASDGFALTDQRGPPGWPARRADEYPQSGKRIDSQRGERRTKLYSRAWLPLLPPALKMTAFGRSKHFRPECGERGYPRGGDCGSVNRAHDPFIPWELAQHPDHCCLHPAIDFDLHYDHLAFSAKRSIS